MAAAHAIVFAILVKIVVLAGKGALCAGLARNVVLLGGQCLAPLLFRFFDFFAHLRLMPLAGSGSLS